MTTQTRTRHSSAILILMVLGTCWLIQPASAVTQWWDTSTNKDLTAGNGPWDTISNIWAGSSTPGYAAPVPWTNGNDAVFGVAAVVTVNGVSANSVTFTASGITLNPGSAPLVLNGALTNTGNALVVLSTPIAMATNQPWYVSQYSTVTMLGAITGAFALAKSGAGTLILSNAANQISSGLGIDGPVQAYNGGNVLGGGALTLGLTPPSGLASLTLNTTTAGPTVFAVGDITNAGSAQVTLNTTPANSTNILSAAALVRPAGGTLQITPLNALGTREQVTFTGGAITPVNGMLAPWIVDTKNATFVSYNGGLTDVVYDTGTWDNTRKISLSTATNLAQDASVYAMKLGANLALGGITLNAAGGGFIFNNTGIYGTGTVSFGPAELVVYAPGNGVIGPSISGTGGLTLFGGGILTLSNLTYTGNTWINQGTLTLALATNTVYGNSVFGVGTLNKAGSASLTLAGSTGSVGAVTITNNGTLAVANAVYKNLANVTLSGPGTTMILTNAQLYNNVPNNFKLATASLNGQSNSLYVLGSGPGTVPTRWDGGKYGLTIGTAGSTGNLLVVDGGGVTGGAIVTNMIFNTSGLAVGGGNNAVGNSAVITNGGVVWDELTINNGGNGVAWGTGYVPLVNANSNSLKIVGGNGIVSTLYKGYPVGIGLGTNTGNIAIVDGAGYPGSAVWTNGGGAMTVGSSGAFDNHLLITNGGIFAIGSLTIGNSANSNRVDVVGTGSLYTGDAGNNTLSIGAGSATGNVLNIANGGLVQSFVPYDVRVGGTAGGAAGYSIGNRMIIGSNATFRPVNKTFIGGNNGAGSAAISNGVLVAGAGALWNAGSAAIYIGQENTGSTAIGNWLLVDAGGVVSNVSGFTVGALADTTAGGAATGNYAVITNGSRLVFANAGTGYIGSSAPSNAVTVVGGPLGPSQWNLGSRTLNVGYGAVSLPVAVGNTLTVDGLGMAGGALITNGTITVGGSAGVGASATGNRLVVTNGGVFYGTLSIGSGTVSNTVAITGSGSALKGTGTGTTLSIGSTSNGIGNAMLIDGQGVAGGAWATNVTIVQLGYIAAAPFSASFGNTLIVTNGGQLFSSQASLIGVARFVTNLTSSANAVTVTGTGSLWNAGAQNVTIGSMEYSNATGVANSLSVTQGGSVSNVATLTVGYVGPNTASVLVSNNTLTVNGNSSVYATTATVGSGAPSGNNTLALSSGGLLEASTLTVSTPGNAITNNGGIFQFPTVTPTITTNGIGTIAISGGTISFRSVTNADIRGNWSGSQLPNMSWSGTNNGFRLTFASNTAASCQNYIFEPGVAPTNYARLEMVSGSTCYRGQITNSLTIGLNSGSSASMLCSNTAAVVMLPFTNNGTLRIVNSTLTFTTNAVLNGTVIIDLNSLTSTNAVLIAQRDSTLGGALQFVGTPTTNLTLMTYAGARNGHFTVTGLPYNYSVFYSATQNGAVTLKKTPPGTALFMY